MRYAPILVAIVLLSPTSARAQGLDAEYAPERQIRVPELVAPEPEPDMDRARPYREGQLVPPGHEVVTTYHGPLLGSGVALLAFHWVLSLVLARTDLSFAEDGVERAEGRNNPLMAPLIGPFVALGTDAERPGAEYALLAVDGIAQLGGLTMAMIGLTLRQRWLVPLAPAELGVRAGPGGARLELRF